MASLIDALAAGRCDDICLNRAAMGMAGASCRMKLALLLRTKSCTSIEGGEDLESLTLLKDAKADMANILSNLFFHIFVECSSDSSKELAMSDFVPGGKNFISDPKESLSSELKFFFSIAV